MAYPDARRDGSVLMKCVVCFGGKQKVKTIHLPRSIIHATSDFDLKPLWTTSKSKVQAGCLSEIPAASLPAHPLLNFVFNSLQVSSSFDLAVEVLVELVNHNKGLPQLLLCRVGFLKEVLLHPALNNLDEKVIGGIACLMSEIGQAAPSLIVEATPEALALADSLLRSQCMVSHM